jgi:adenylate kinase family enzyme
MKRVLIIGSSGAGKSTFAIELGKKLNLPVIHLDKEFWQPGWIETPRDVWSKRVGELVKGAEWIIDGTYDRTLDVRLPHADTVFFLDYPRHLCLWRTLKRIVSSFGHVRGDMAEGCPEKVDLGFFKWVWNYRRDRYPKINECLRKYFAHGNLVVFRSPIDAMRYLNALE